MKTVKILMLLAVLTMVWGCTKEDDTIDRIMTFEKAVKPTWKVDLTSNDTAPIWTAPDPTLFESSMFIMVRLQDELKPFSTDDDLMSVFIGDECRTVPAVRNVDDKGDIFFMLKIRGNSTDRDVTLSLCYYCAGLHQLFTLRGQERFATERTYGVNEDFTPPLLKGSYKYPVQTTLTVNITENEYIKADEGDIVAAFVGNECRGVGKLGEPFTVFRTNESEIIQLRYYSTEKGGVYTTRDIFYPKGNDIYTLI